MNEMPAPGSRVRLNAAGHKRLGLSRRRDASVCGTVLGESQGFHPDFPRAVVEWDKPKYTESVRPAYLEEVTQ